MAMHFYRREKFHSFLYLRANLLHFVQEVKYFGLIFDYSKVKAFKGERKLMGAQQLKTVSKT